MVLELLMVEVEVLMVEVVEVLMVEVDLLNLRGRATPSATTGSWGTAGPPLTGRLRELVRPTTTSVGNNPNDENLTLGDTRFKMELITDW